MSPVTHCSVISDGCLEGIARRGFLDGMPGILFDITMKTNRVEIPATVNPVRPFTASGSMLADLVACISQVSRTHVLDLIP